MAVNLPRPQRLQQDSSPTPQNQRINIQAPSNANAILQQTQAVASLGSEALNAYQDIENNKIQSISQKFEQDLKTWNDNKLSKLKSSGGDPTEVYSNYETELKEKYDSLLKTYPDMNDRVKRHVTSSLDKYASNERHRAMRQRGAQQETYDHNLFESSVKLKRNNMVSAAGNIQKGNPSSFIFMDEAINDLKTSISQRAIKQQNAKIVDKDSKDFTHAYRDAEGNIVKVKMDDIAKFRTAKELSQGISDSINSMINAGYVVEAKEAHERYKGFIDKKTETKLAKKFKTDTNKSEAKQIYGAIQGQDPEKQIEIINKIADPDIKEEVLKYKDTIERRIENDRERRVKRNYDTLSKFVQNRMSSDKPFNGMAELEDEQAFKETWDNLDAKSQQAVREMVIAPKKSNQKSIAKVHSLLFGEDKNNNIEDMSIEDFQLQLTGLSSADRRRYITKFEKLKEGPNASTQRAVFNRASRQLKNRMLLSETIKRDDFGRFSRKDEKKLIKRQEELIDFLGDNPENLNDKQIKDKIDEFTATQVREDVGFLGRIFGGGSNQVAQDNVRADQVGTTTSAPIRGEKKDISTLSLTEMYNLKKEFKQEFGYSPLKSDPKLIDFYKSR